MTFGTTIVRRLGPKEPQPPRFAWSWPRLDFRRFLAKRFFGDRILSRCEIGS